MLTSSQSDGIPDNVRLFPGAADDYRALDRGRRVKVVKALRKIAHAPSELGKPLENQKGRPLAGFRSVYVDKKSLRIIWRVISPGQVEVVVVAGIAEREAFFAYDLVAKRRAEIEEYVERLSRAPD